MVPDSSIQSAGWYINIIKLRNDKALHYQVARQPGREMNFVLLGTYQDPGCSEDDLRKLLSIGEALLHYLTDTA